MTEGKVRLFDLLSGVPARERQAFAAERRRRNAREGVREELVRDQRGKWVLAYFFGTRKFDELRVPSFIRKRPL